MSDPKMTKASSGATAVPRAEPEEAENDEGAPRPPMRSSDPAASYSEYIQQVPRPSPQTGSRRSVIGGTGRGDESIHRDVRDALEHDGTLAAADDMEIHVHDGRVELRGHVPSVRIRFRAGRIAAGVSGVCEVSNELEVVDDR